jgi:hypothetical protein
MSTITIELPDDLTAQIDPATLPMLLRALVAHKATKLQALEQSAKQPPPLYHEITDFLATSPTAEQIIAFKISAAAPACLVTPLSGCCGCMTRQESHTGRP